MERLPPELGYVTVENLLRESLAGRPKIHYNEGCVLTKNNQRFVTRKEKSPLWLGGQRNFYSTTD